VSVRWQVELTPQVERWYMGLKTPDAERIAPSLDELERIGPALGRPFVDSVKGSRHHNMKELRSIGGNLRALFAFDPRRHAIVLVAGDKSRDWKGWYRRNIPVADRRYEEHVRDIGGGGECRGPSRGGPSGDRGR
jgi:hypothetical protein